MDAISSLRAACDVGPWVRHPALAGRTLADPDGNHQVPAAQRSGNPLVELDEQIARWSPLLHVLVHGLGWTRVDAGLARWLAVGQPVEDPVLRLVRDWYGDDVLDVLAWSEQTGALVELAEHLGQRTPWRRALLDALPSDPASSSRGSPATGPAGATRCTWYRTP